jgi:hypothetical protein
LPWSDGDSGLAELSTQGPGVYVELIGHGRQGVALEVQSGGFGDEGVGHLPGHAAAGHTLVVKVFHDDRPVDPVRPGQLFDRDPAEIGRADVVDVASREPSLYRATVSSKAVPEGPQVVARFTTFAQVTTQFACPIAQIGSSLLSNPGSVTELGRSAQKGARVEARP